MGRMWLAPLVLPSGTRPLTVERSTGRVSKNRVSVKSLSEQGLRPSGPAPALTARPGRSRLAAISTAPAKIKAVRFIGKRSRSNKSRRGRANYANSRSRLRAEIEPACIRRGRRSGFACSGCSGRSRRAAQEPLEIRLDRRVVERDAPLQAQQNPRGQIDHARVAGAHVGGDVEERHRVRVAEARARALHRLYDGVLR